MEMPVSRTFPVGKHLTGVAPPCGMYTLLLQKIEHREVMERKCELRTCRGYLLNEKARGALIEQNLSSTMRYVSMDGAPNGCWAVGT